MIPTPVLPDLDPANLFLIAVALLAGLSRGFSGFGGALVLVPPLAAIHGPIVAAPAFLISDAIMSLPMVHNAVRKCVWPDLKWIVAGAIVGLPLGVQLLTTTDPTLIRWVVSAFILLSLALLASGWRYTGPPRPGITFAVGTVSGTLSGMATIGGPPVIVYMLGGTRPVEIIRANIFTYFAAMTVVTLTLFVFRGLYTGEVLGLFLIIAPSYALGLTIGARLFPFASQATFRLIAYVLIALSAVSSMPVLDPILRPGG
ncbi:MAG: hypothetical protein RLZ98_628 [Pseudomonadota bacterium]|jgi:uncharacterized membrane protein YfcA